MKLQEVNKLNVAGKKVIVRADLDISEGDQFRLKSLIETLKFLSENKAKTIIIGHKGRPGGKVVGELSLAPVAKEVGKLLGKEIKFVYDIVGREAQEEAGKLQDSQIVMFENLRFDAREEKNNQEFAKSLASLGEIYVNEAFAVSHREHSSIVSLPKLLPKTAGIHLAREVENLNRVIEDPVRPLLMIISGIKKDKLEYIESLKKTADKVLVGGRLPEYMGEDYSDEKVLVARLNPDKEDITIHSIELFETEIAKAKTIVLAGVPGKYEEEGHRLGTERVFKAVAASSAFKVVGGGDSLAVISMYSLGEKFDWISVGGGAMLEFLAHGTLPGIQALLD